MIRKMLSDAGQFVLACLLVCAFLAFVVVCVWLDFEAYRQRFPHAQPWTYFFQRSK